MNDEALVLVERFGLLKLLQCTGNFVFGVAENFLPVARGDTQQRGSHLIERDLALQQSYLRRAVCRRGYAGRRLARFVEAIHSREAFSALQKHAGTLLIGKIAFGQ